MSLGLFSNLAVPAGWFDETAQPAGWFDAQLLDAPIDPGPGRTVVAYSRPGLLRGIPSRRYGSFARASSVATDVSPRVLPRGTVSAGKFQQAGLTAAARFRASTTGQLVVGPTYDQTARTRALGASTAAKTAPGDLSAALRARASTGATPIRPATAAAALRWRGSVTVEKVPQRDVQRFSRPGLLRGLPMRLYGSFQRAGVIKTTDIAARFTLRGTPGAGRLGTANIAARVALPALTSASKQASTDIAARAGRLATPGVSKRGQGDLAGRLAARGEIISYAFTDGRAISRFTTPSLYLVPARRYGSFARTPGAHMLAFRPFSTSTTANKIGLYGVAGTVRPQASTSGVKRGEAALAGRLLPLYGSTVDSKIGAATVSATLTARGASTYLRITGPTVDQAGRFGARGASTYARTSTAAMSARLGARGATTAESRRSTDVAGRLTFRADVLIGGNPEVDVASLLTFLASTTAEARPWLLRGRLVFGAQVTATKRAENGGATGLLAPRSTTTASKQAEAAAFGRFMFRLTTALPQAGLTARALAWRIEGGAASWRIEPQGATLTVETLPARATVE